MPDVQSASLEQALPFSTGPHVLVVQPLSS
jgi:hypothetical protein